MDESGKSAETERNFGEAMIKIHISEDAMEAKADFFPAELNNKPLSLEYIDSMLINNNIVHGILYENIQEAILTCNTEKKTLPDVLIARGNPPKDEIVEYLQKNPQLDQKISFNTIQKTADKTSSIIPDKNRRIDYKDFTPFIIVKKGQVLARKNHRRPGTNGKSIYGSTIPYKVIHPHGVEMGSNTRMHENFLISIIDGQLIEVKGTLNVNESLDIKGPVGYKTGNIAFPGDIVIEGPVSDGFKIYCGGSLTIKQTFDVTDVTTKGDLNVAGGIIGRGMALIKVGGNIRTKFIENCRIACRKTVFVTSDIVNSQIYSLEKIEMGDKGKIIGGEFSAINGIRAASIGRKSSRGVNIRCGLDFTAEQEKERNNNALRLLAGKLSSISTLLEDPAISRDKKDKLEELRTRLMEEQKKASAKISELMGNIMINENAAVEITGEIAAGTCIEICQSSFVVSEPLRKVRVRLDKEKNKLVTEPL